MPISATPEDHLRALATGDNEAAAEALREALESEDAVVRESVARVMVKALTTAAPQAIGPIADLLQEVVDPFSPALATASFEAAVSAAERSKGSIDSLLLMVVHACSDAPALEPRLIPLLKHASAGVRAVAAGALGRVARGDAAPMLLPLLEDPNAQVALAALDGALTLVVEAPDVLMPAIAALLPKLKGEARYSALTGLRGVLRELPDLAAKLGTPLVPAILRALEDDEDPALQFEACALLGLVPPSPETIKALSGRLGHEAAVSCCAAGSLIELGADLSAPVSVLQRCCESKDVDEQNAGFGALGELSPAGLKRAGALLAALEKSPDPVVKESARSIRTPPE